MFNIFPIVNQSNNELIPPLSIIFVVKAWFIPLLSCRQKTAKNSVAQNDIFFHHHDQTVYFAHIILLL